MSRERCMQLLRDADAVINLCGATEPRDEHRQNRCLVLLETDPGVLELEIARKIPAAISFAQSHKLFFTYGYNIGAPDCLLPAAGVNWRPTRPPVVLDEWLPGVVPAEPQKFTTVGTWQNHGNDMEIAGETYYWSKDVNFRKMLEVAGRASQPIELASDLKSGPDYERALRGGFSITPVVPMSLDIDDYRKYISGSRRVHRRQRHLRAAAHRMVQRSHGVLPRCRATSRYAADRFREDDSYRRGADRIRYG
jgi:hypothetical protein